MIMMEAISSDPHDVIRVLVGTGQREFVVHRALLCASSPFFRDSIDAVPDGLASSPKSPPRSTKAPLIWLTGESADVFELFVLWLYRGHAFRAVVDDAVTILAAEDAGDPAEPVELLPPTTDDDDDDTDRATITSATTSTTTSTTSTASANLSDLHWHLVHLHLFAALVDIPALQDVVMDALQDLYLRFDWAATPALLRFLYAEADPLAAFRLRKWAVALLAWTLANADHPAADGGRASSRASSLCADATRELLAFLAATPQLAADYDAHRAKMRASRADARIKNPQLRIPSNHLRREDRHFGFRQCSFHSHRRAVGEGRCPHAKQRRTFRKVQIYGLGGSGGGGGNDNNLPTRRAGLHSPSESLSSLSSACSSASSEPRRVDLPAWSPLSVTTPGYAPLGMESTI